MKSLKNSNLFSKNILSESSPLTKIIASIFGVPLTCSIVTLTSLFVKR